MNKETFTHSAWYRLLKTIYLGVFILVMLISLAGLWSTYNVYISDYEVKNSPKYIEDDGLRGLVTKQRIRAELTKTGKQAALTNIILFTPIILFSIWAFSLFIKRLFFYITFGDKFLRLPKKLFD